MQEPEAFSNTPSASPNGSENQEMRQSARSHWAISPIDTHHLWLFLDPVDGKQFVYARLLPTDAHRGEESLSFLP
jgi:hypothetical protein